MMALNDLMYAAPGSKTFASDSFAALTRQQWDDYLRDYIPIENLMIRYATDEGAVGDAVMNARADVANAFDAQRGIQERRVRGLGLELRPDEQASIDRQSNLAESLADVTAANLTQQRTEQRQRGLMGMPMPQVG
jgi:hypothetical protein